MAQVVAVSVVPLVPVGTTEEKEKEDGSATNVVPKVFGLDPRGAASQPRSLAASSAAANQR